MKTDWFLRESTAEIKLQVVAKNISGTKSSKKITCKISISLSLYKLIYKDYQESSVLSTYEIGPINAKKKKEKSTFAPKYVYEDHKIFLEFLSTHLEEEIICKKS